MKLPRKRLVYVSWRDTTQNERQWLDSFFDRLKIDVVGLSDEFAEPLRTPSPEEIQAGRLLATLPDPADKSSSVTDVVGVLNQKYLAANGKPNGELARVFGRALKHDPIRVFLAPIVPPFWKGWQIADVRLADPEKRNAWLIRLRDDTAFIWPSYNEWEANRQIAEAVITIIEKGGQ